MTQAFGLAGGARHDDRDPQELELNYVSWVESRLSLAIESNDLGQVRALLQAGANPYFIWHCAQEYHFTALSFAIGHDNVKLVRLLLDNGVSPDRCLPSRSTRRAYFPLHYALLKGDLACYEICRLLEERGSSKTNDMSKRASLVVKPSAVYSSKWVSVYWKCASGVSYITLEVKFAANVPTSLQRGWGTVESLFFSSTEQFVEHDLMRYIPPWLFKMKRIRCVKGTNGQKADLTKVIKWRNCFNACVAVHLSCLHRFEDKTFFQFVPKEMFFMIIHWLWSSRDEKVWL